MNDKIKSKQLTIFMIICMVYPLLVYTSEIVLHKIILVETFSISVSSFVAPVWFVLNDVVAEFYGYRLSRKMFYIFLTTVFIFSVIVDAIIVLPSPASWHWQSSYNYVLGEITRQFVAGAIGFIVGGTINIKLLLKWKAIFRGRYFILRSIFSSIIGEFIFTVIAYSIIAFGTHGLIYEKIIPLIISGTILKSLGNIVLAPFSIMLLNYLKRLGPTYFLDAPITFNPFNKEVDVNNA